MFWAVLEEVMMVFLTLGFGAALRARTGSRR